VVKLRELKKYGDDLSKLGKKELERFNGIKGAQDYLWNLYEKMVDKKTNMLFNVLIFICLLINCCAGFVLISAWILYFIPEFFNIFPESNIFILIPFTILYIFILCIITNHIKKSEIDSIEYKTNNIMKGKTNE
jgi:hypothetical protein